MQRLSIRRVRFCVEADNRLKQLKSKTGITPNLLCRIGFCLSLEEPGVPNPDRYPEGPRDINRQTLMGQYDEVFEALLKQRVHEDGLAQDCLDEQFHAHMNRGVILLSSRVRNLTDLAAFDSQDRYS